MVEDKHVGFHNQYKVRVMQGVRIHLTNECRSNLKFNRECEAAQVQK